MADVLVLCYHLVDPDCQDEMAVSPDALRRQLRAVLRRGYRAVTFTAAVAGRMPTPTVVVTFDDGFAGTYDHAAPVLDELGVPGTVFVPSGLVTRAAPMTWPGLERHRLTAHQRRPATWRQLSELADTGWEIGSHSVTHACLDACSDEELDAQLRDSRAECEDRVQHVCTSLAYPFGRAGERVRSAARRAGYGCAAVLGDRRGGNGPWAVGRVGVYHRDDDLRLRLKVSPLLRSHAGLRAVEGARRLLTQEPAGGRGAHRVPPPAGEE